MPGASSARPVVLDTNAALAPFRDRTDLEEELNRVLGAHACVLPASVVQELDAMAAGGGAAARNARAARKLADARFRVEPTDLPGDDGVLDVARRLGAAVVTNDRRLQAECRRSGLTVVAGRGPGRLHERA